MENDLTKEQQARLESKIVMSSEIRTMAKEIGRNHAAALRLWEIKATTYRQLAILIMDKAFVPELLDRLISDIEKMDTEAIEKLGEWLMANQIMNLKDKDRIMEAWIDESSALKQSLFWSNQARMIRKQKCITSDQAKYISIIEARIGNAKPLVQWNMNYCAAQIGIFDQELREKCIGLGEKFGLYKEYKVPKGCTSPYLPLWINSEVNKNKNR